MVPPPLDALFFGAASLSTVAVWAALSWLRGADYHDSRRYAVATRPSFLPTDALLLLLRTRWLYLGLCHSAPLAMGLAALLSGTAYEAESRLLAALLYSMYSLAETATTHSHRDFATLYICWAFALLPAPWASATSLGVAAHFVASSGLAKCVVAGWREWGSPGTLRAVLKAYLAYDDSDGPGLPQLTRWMLGRDWVLELAATGTLVLECIAVPAALVLSPQLRPAIAVALIAMHVGIALSQSLLIGLAFCPNIGTYLSGFASGTHALSTEWWLASVAILAASPLHWACTGRLLPENWPCTPLALFPWSGRQWDVLFAAFASGSTRLVLGTAGLQVSEQDCSRGLVGRRIARSWSPSSATAEQSDDTQLVYDGWEQVIGETLFHPEIVAALGFEQQEADRTSTSSIMAGSNWDAHSFTRAVQRWLLRDRRLVVIESGRVLSRAWFVRVDSDGRKILEVLATG